MWCTLQTPTAAKAMDVAILSNETGGPRGQHELERTCLSMAKMCTNKMHSGHIFTARSQRWQQMQ